MRSKRNPKGSWWLLLAVFVLLGLAILVRQGREDPASSGSATPAVAVDAVSDGTVEQAYQDRRSGVVVEVAGTVRRLLSDDDEGSRHQRFILELGSGQTLLVAHNIDLADRVPLREGGSIRARGQYEWNERGGVLHWTHHDPQGQREGGWILHEGKTYR